MLVFILIMIPAVFTIERSYSQNTSISSDATGNSYLGQVSDLINPIVVAGGAIGGGVIGSLLTYRHNRRIEEQKNEYAKKDKERERNRQRQDENLRYAKLRTLVISELTYYSIFIGNVVDDPEHSSNQFRLFKTQLPFHSQYQNLPIDTRISMFGIDSLYKIENAYNQTSIFMRLYDMLSTEKLLELSKPEERREVGKGLKQGAILLKGFIDEALVSLEKDKNRNIIDSDLLP